MGGRYLAQFRSEGETWASMMEAAQIIDAVDMSDCSGIEEVAVWDVSRFGEAERLAVKGPWHDFLDPLYICAVRGDGTVAFDGYGTDH